MPMDAAANPWARNSLPLNHGAKKASNTVGASSQGTNKDVTIPRISEASGSGDQDSSMLSAVQIDDVILVYDPRLVYEPSDDSFLFLDTLNRKMFRDASILDMGSGTGILGIYFGKEARRVVFVDLNPNAVLYTWLNCWLNDLSNYDVRLGILFKAIKPGEVFDYVLFNAPYLIEEPLDPEDPLEYAWSGLPALKRFLEEFPRFTLKSAFVTMNNYSFAEVQPILERYEYKILAKRSFFFEEIMLLEIKSNWNWPERRDNNSN
jgi:HemK-related putative methylase